MTPKRGLGLYLFSALELDERADALWSEGTFLIATDHPKGPSAFYAYADYWVEVLLEGEDQRIVAVVPFRKGDRLERLLSVITPSQL